ncbi:hypothetical protein [Niastella populi]|uniref:Uncharacterized protein n=1 Tax=Niastella populi TaxID=550983 RepID=A0A1V9ELD2_9BACT|nr:hypothetical protein [Niastella populi]OQP46675.1 hypothetical protein A4R26_08125 [Niastella populi]
MVLKTSRDERCFYGKKTTAENVAIMAEHLAVLIPWKPAPGLAGIDKQNYVSRITLFIAQISCVVSSVNFI